MTEPNDSRAPPTTLGGLGITLTPLVRIAEALERIANCFELERAERKAQEEQQAQQASLDDDFIMDEFK